MTTGPDTDTADDEHPPSPPDLGIIGGMGPAATTNFLRQLDGLVDAARDQDHLAYIVWGDPRIPDRSEALLGRGPSPLPHLELAVRKLGGLGVGLIAIPCNTAHHWVDRLSTISDVPIADMILETARRTALLHPGARVCILATLGTSSSPLYRDQLAAHGLGHVPLDASSQDLVEATIRSVKANDLDGARRRLDGVAVLLERHDADVAVIACTDLSHLVAATGTDLGVPTIDASDCLARHCLAHFGLQPRRSGPRS